MRNIDHNPNVAVAIFSTAQVPGNDVVGIQLSGKATKLSGGKVAAACERYFSHTGATTAIGETQPDPADYQGATPEQWQFVRVTPAELWLFDTKQFGEHRVAVPIDKVT